MKYSIPGIALLVALGGALPAGAEPDAWAGYLDYAYIYASATPVALEARLEGYGQEAGVDLQEYVSGRLPENPGSVGPADAVEIRRYAIATLLDYLSRNEPRSLEASVEAVRQLEDQLERHENRYWYHYVRAHQALEQGQSDEFVRQVLALWLHVVVPLESQFETLQTLSLGDSPNSGFASALPYVYENIARLILIRGPRMGMNHGLEALGGIVRLLHGGRVGTHPEVIPLAASSRQYLDRIVQRMNGPESDGGSFSFSLALFEATKVHERARGLLASEGFSPEALEAIRITGTAYKTALAQAATAQGHCAVHTRVLRQLGEIFAAKQRLGVDPELDLPFSVEDAIDVYGEMSRGQKDRWRQLGYAKHGRQALLTAMRGLWEEIQESTLNVADYYLSLALERPHRADEFSRSAARLYGRYLSFFLEHTTGPDRSGIPESAYFAAHEAARSIGDAFLSYAERPSREQIELAVTRYRGALRLFPFDRSVWAALAAALERQGRGGEYMSLARRTAEGVTHSRALDTWIEQGEADAERVATLRRAFSDSHALVYLGFADAKDVTQLAAELEALRARRDETKAGLDALLARSGRPRSRHAVSAEAVPANAAPLDAAASAQLASEIIASSALLERLENQVEARSRTLPLYEATLGTDGLAEELRSRRDHPLHALLRRMYHEDRL